MANASRRSPAIRARLRALGNPYAALQMFDEEEVVESQRERYRQSENPHAFDYYMDAAKPAVTADASTSAPPASHRGKLSKEAFREGCRAIFRPYIPALEKGKLRAHHRVFILRNEQRSAEMRFALVAELKKYDLSDIPGLSSQFNRERDTLTEEKLAAIERAVGITE
jgi:hypothetical protein